MARIKPMRIVGYVGRVLLATGVLVLAFVAYQLWGTGLHEAQAQNELSEEFEALLAAAPTTSATTEPAEPTGPTSTLAPEIAPTQDLDVAVGDPIGRMRIPELNVDKIVVEGVPLAELDRAPGHYPQTAYPGQLGNPSFAGHRTTYGAPFFNIDKLKPGDEIHITTLQGEFTYRMLWSKIVQPEEMWVLDPDPEHPATLTLTACHPRLDLSQRYIVRAELVGKPVPRLPGQDAAMKEYAETSDALADGVTAASHPGAWPQVLLWGAICAAIWLGVWFLSRRWRRAEHRLPPRWIRAVVPYVVGVPVFSVALFFAFENLANIVPAGL